MQAIMTKFIGPTNYRGARIRVWAAAGWMYVSWDYTKNVEENHKAAAMLFVKKYNWPSKMWYSGGLPDGSGDVFVCKPSRRK